MSDEEPDQSKRLRRVFDRLPHGPGRRAARPPAPPVPHRQHPRQQLPHASEGGTLQSDPSPCEPNGRRIASSDRGSVMTTALPALTLSVPETLPLLMPIDAAVVPPCFAVPAPTAWLAQWPSRRDHCGESDPPRGGLSGGPKGGPLNLLRWRISAQKGGVALTTSTPLVRRAVTPGGRGTREAQPRFALSHRGRGIRVVPRPVRRFGEIPNHAGEGSAL